MSFLLFEKFLLTVMDLSKKVEKTKKKKKKEKSLIKNLLY